MSSYNRKTLTVGKTDGFGFNVLNWLDGETITSFTATHTDGLLSVDSTEIDGTQLKILATGLIAGNAEVTFNFATDTRSRCATMIISVRSECG